MKEKAEQEAEKAFEKMKKKKEELGITINRVPQKDRDEFKQIANEEFEGDYGMLLKHLLEHYKMNKIFFENFDYKLDEIRYAISNQTQHQEVQEDSGPKNFAGEPIKFRGGKKNG